MCRSERYCLILAFVLAIGLRLIGIHSREIQYDDAFSIFLARQNLGEIINGTAADTMPPLYYFLLHFWQKISDQLVFMRLLSVGLSLFGWLIAVDLTRRMFGSWTAITAGILIAVAPLQIYHSQDLRMYALLMTGQLAYYWFFYRIFEESEKRTGFWAGLIISGSVAMYSHALGGFGLIWGNIYLLLKKRWDDQLRLIKAQLIIGLVYLPWAFLLPGQIAKVQTAFWTPKPGIVEIFHALILFHANLPLKGVILPICAVLSAQVFSVVIWELWKARNEKSSMALLTLIFLGFPLLLIVISYLMQPVFVTRVFILSSVMYSVIAARIIVLRWKRGIGTFLFGGFLLAAVLSLPSLYTYNEFPRSPFRQAVAYLNLPQNSDGFVLHDNKLSYFPMRFYDENHNAAFLADEPGSPNDTLAMASQQAMGIYPVEEYISLLAGKERFFFIVFQKSIDEYAEVGANHPVLEVLSTQYALTKHTLIGDLEIYEYMRRP
ncbi:MAG: membrane protein [Bellilinea sp.]|nr:MAG: membrane protein [Bellilinea sp.]